jgi:steroid delta-isomerase-like uncharacterized protein
MGEAMTEEMKAITLRAEELWNEGNMSIADEMYAPSNVNHDPFLPEVNDLESFKKYITQVREGMPDFQVKIEDMIAEIDKLACRWVASGTHKKDFFGIPASGKRATWTGMTIYRFENGKIVEGWWNKDTFAMLQQLGIIPTQ